eukprot:s1730_g14.t1
MAMALPPDPKKTSGVVEVGHDSLLCLVVGHDGQKSVLCNELTGEMCKLPACPDDGRLHFTAVERFGYMTIKKKSRWCKEFLMWTVFELHGEQFAYRKTSTGYECRWLSDFTGRFWTRHCDMTMVRLEQCAGSSGCRSFVSLADALALLKEDSVTGRFIAKKLQKTYIPVIGKHVGSKAQDHVLFTDRAVWASMSSEENQDLKQVTTPMISIVGFLILMLHFTAHGQQAVKKASMCLLYRFLSSFGIGPDCHESKETLQVAKIIETRIVLLDWQRNESVQVEHQKSRRDLAKDARSHKKKNKKGPSRSSLGSFGTTSISSRKRGVYVGFDKRQQQQLTRYYLGARQQFSECNIIALSGDEARVGGKSRFYGALMNLLTGMTCWGPPQDSCDNFTCCVLWSPDELADRHDMLGTSSGQL